MGDHATHGLKIDQDPERVAHALRGVVIDFGLRRLQATTDTHVVTVEEPDIWSNETDLLTEIKVIDI